MNNSNLSAMAAASGNRIVYTDLPRLIARYGALACRVDNLGEIELLIEGDEENLWLNITELDPPGVKTTN